MLGKKIKKKVWSRKGKCPYCKVGSGSKHSKKCKLDYRTFDKYKVKGNDVIFSKPTIIKHIINIIIKAKKLC